MNKSDIVSWTISISPHQEAFFRPGMEPLWASSRRHKRQSQSLCKQPWTCRIFCIWCTFE